MNEKTYTITEINGIVSKLYDEIDNLKHEVALLKQHPKCKYDPVCDEWYDELDDTRCGIGLFDPKVSAVYDGKKVLVQSITITKDREVVTHIIIDGIVTTEKI